MLEIAGGRLCGRQLDAGARSLRKHEEAGITHFVIVRLALLRDSNVRETNCFLFFETPVFCCGACAQTVLNSILKAMGRQPLVRHSSPTEPTACSSRARRY